MSSSTITRRTLLARSLSGVGVGWIGKLLPAGSSSVAFSALAQPISNPGETAEATRSERAGMSNVAQAFMQQYDVPGLSVAIGHAGTLVYEGAFGWADREKREAVSPSHLFRIASVSKPITSVAVFSLLEAGHIHLSDRIFGRGAILGTDYGGPPYHPQVDEITVGHLLTHTSGGWSNNPPDPMHMNLEMNHAQLIKWTLRHQPLDHPPGQNYAYSNFGYCVLGRVIEKITRQPYAVYVGNTVLKRCGISDTAISGNTLAQRRRGEVMYYGQGENPYGMNVARMDSCGGWIARPADLVQFLMHVSGFDNPPNILKPETLQTMTTASVANTRYAKGWWENRVNNWWHSGGLPGTATVVVRTHSGFCWAAFANTLRRNSPMVLDLSDKLVWNMISQVKSWRV